MVKGSDGKPKIAQDFGVHPFKSSGPISRFLSVDPGDVHVGVAEWGLFPNSGWACTWAGEMTPSEFLAWLAEGLRGTSRWDYLIVEEWRLFPEHAPRAIGSDMPTSRLIGGIQALADYLPNQGWLIDKPEVPVVLQSPQIKVPTRGLLKRRKLRSIAKVLGVPGDHATDAELHGYKYLKDRGWAWENSTQQAERLRDRRLTPSQALW